MTKCLRELFYEFVVIVKVIKTMVIVSISKSFTFLEVNNYVSQYMPTNMTFKREDALDLSESTGYTMNMLQQ